MIDWIETNPSAFASLASAVIAASVALIVFSLSQYYSRRQNRTQFLTPRLEEIHEILDFEMQCNIDRLRFLSAYAEGDDAVSDVLSEFHELDLYGHKNTAKIIMLVTLYFPKLTHIHIQFHQRHRILNDLIFRVIDKQIVDHHEIIDALGQFSHLAMLARQEITRNRDFLVGDCNPFKRYCETTEEEIKSVAPPPPIDKMWAG